MPSAKFIVYLATNSANGKRYVGQTRQGLAARKSGHKHAALSTDNEGVFYDAIRKYGWGAFEWEVLEECVDLIDLDMAERFWIDCYGTLAPNGYNLETGGWGRKEISQQTRDKIGAAQRGKTVSAETRRKIGEANKGHRNYLTPEMQSKIQAKRRETMARAREEDRQAYAAWVSSQ